MVIGDTILILMMKIIEEAVKDIVHNYLNRGYHDDKLEGFPIDGQKCEKTNTYVYIED